MIVRQVLFFSFHSMMFPPSGARKLHQTLNREATCIRVMVLNITGRFMEVRVACMNLCEAPCEEHPADIINQQKNVIYIALTLRFTSQTAEETR